MNEPIFIARQDTLDEKIIPAQLLNDYKLHGEYSFVFHTPELWHKMCTHAYAANDQKVNGEALEYVLTKAAPTGSYSLSNWMALLCDTAEQAAQGLYAGIETAGQLAQSSAAMAAVSNSETAMAAVSNEFSTISSCAEMAENSTAMSVLAASETAMSVLADSATARTALTGSSYYGKYMQNDTMCIAKLAVGFANLASVGYSSMAGVAADATAMNAVAASSTAMNAVAASTTAMDALYARKKNMSGGSASKSGKFIILEISANNAFDTSKYGYVTLSDGSKPNWDNYLAKYAFFKQYPKYATYMRNDTDSDDYIYYFDITNP